ncbi:hypothetical protein [Cellulomonas dongxiuzhuiae]|uniref:hypothetical protein n=1 Tax=Cellulomonas dongxiuzhuiae TaxID=2819979 RepID=UPI001AB01D1D|nr:hypothetical protein [Cellulomonas dongxiuzhuiae]MBO3089479.1 hypothetical protein [Cellulomonas dongxiuzhuiae]
MNRVGTQAGALASARHLGDLAPLSTARRRRWPLALLLVGALLAAVAWWDAVRPPASLAESTLVGARGPACVRLVVAEDVSGSMSEFAAARRSALAELVAWAPRNLRANDELVVLGFAGSTDVPWGPWTVADLPGAPGRTGGAAVADGTLLGPVTSAVAQLPPAACDTLLVLLSDAQLGDLPADEVQGLQVLTDAGIHDLRLLVPTAAIDVPGEWADVFPSAPPVVVDGTDVAATGLTVARMIAQVTDQEVVRR